MKKVFLALGHRQLEDYLEKKLSKEFNFVGRTVYREGIVKGIKTYNPDILIVRETLEGSTNITNLIYEIRVSYPDTRIIFISKQREAGDALLSTIVGYGVYDIIMGDKINTLDIVNLMKEANKISDVMKLLPKTTVDEKANTKIFEAPTIVVEQPQRIDKKEKKTEGSTKIKDEELNSSINKKEGNLGRKTSEKEEELDNTIIQIVNESEVEKKVQPEVIPNKKTVKSAEAEDESKTPSEKRTFFGKNKKETFVAKSTKQQIITFLGSKKGIGNTHIAFNTAIKLSQRGFKTIFIELNDTESTISYIYQIGDYYNGLDTALDNIKSGNYFKVDEAIISMKNIVKETPKDNSMINNYKQFPEDLDFMFFSHEYMEKKSILEEGGNADNLKDLLMYLSFQKEYDFIILDASPEMSNKLTEISLVYATKIYNLIIQDVSSIYSSITQLKEMEKKRINLKEKLYYIINKYENAILTSRDIEEWIKDYVDIDPHINIFIPDANKDFIESNYIGNPVILNTKNKDVLKGFLKIEESIL